jgi:hypothetical protein
MKMKITKLWTFLVPLYFCLVLSANAQNAMVHNQLTDPPYPVDTWYLANDGLAPCAATNGAPTGVYNLATHGNLNIRRWSHRRGEMYVEAIMNGCSDGWYKHDTTSNKWVRVADRITGQYASARFYTTNGENIFLLFGGKVYQMIEANEYNLYPNGWKEISAPTFSPLVGSQVWSASCDDSGNDIFENGAKVGDGADFAPSAIGDTIFATFMGTCSTERKIGKFSIKSGTWSFITLNGGLPWEVFPANGALNFTAGWNRSQMIFTYPIAGRFQIFMKIEQPSNFGYGNPSPDSTVCIPSFVWAYDYSNNTWKNISHGPDYNNATPSANPYNSNTMPGFPHNARPNPACLNPDRTPSCGGTHVPWAAPDIYVSFDKRRLYLGSGSVVNGGLYWWQGSGWAQVVSDAMELVRPTNNGIFYKISRYSDGQFYWSNGANNMQVGHFSPSCNTTTPDVNSYQTPDDGKSWYILYKDGSLGCNTPIDRGGVYRLIFSSIDKPASTRNLHLNTGTYLGANGDNIPVGTGVGAGHRIFVAGNFNAGITTSKPYTETNLFSANTLSPGKILALTYKGDSIQRVINIGGRVDEFEVQEVAPYRMVVSGDFGVAVLDSTGTQIIWSRTAAQLNTDGLPASGTIQVDISHSGQVVVGRQGTANGSGRAIVFAPNGTLYTGVLNPNRKFLHDVTIKNDTVVVVGEGEGAKMTNWCGPCGNYQDTQVNPPCPNETTANWPIRVPYVNYHAISGGAVNTTRYAFSYDFPSNLLQADAADAMVYGANFAKDGNLVILGEHAGTNSVFRWDGKTNTRGWYNNNSTCKPPSTLVISDRNSDPAITLNPIVHIGYVGILDPKTGLVIRGALVHGIQNSGAAATTKLRKVNTDLKGYLHIGGTSAAFTKGRNLTNINGNLVGPYAGDATYLMMSSDLKKRMFWGPFNAPGSGASGSITGIGIRDNIISVVATTSKGSFTTTNGTNQTSPAIIAQSFTPNESALNDAYLAAFYQDLWNQSNIDTVKDKVWQGLPLIDSAVLAYTADFTASSRKVCINTPVTIINTSVGDSLLSWDFGDGASLLPGTTGAGPFAVSYSSAGFKTLRLNVTLKNNLPTYNVKDAYIQVLPTGLTLQGSISGPSVVCPGSEAIYSVTPVSGVTRYDWSFPSGTQITYGADGYSVRVVFGNTAGTVSVVGTYACGTTPALTKSVTIATKSETTAILVAKENTANTVMTFDGSGDYFVATTVGKPTLARDSASTYNATVVGTAYLNRLGTSVRDGAATIPTNAGYLSLAGAPRVFSTSSATQAYTIAGWIRPSAVTGATRMILTQKSNTGTNATANDFSLLINTSGQLAAHIGRNGGGPGNAICAGGTLTANVWQHVAFVKAGNGANQVKLYINGVQVAQGTHNSAFSDNATMIGNGANGGTPNNSMTGDIDALAIWNVALDSNSVVSLYNTSLSSVLNKSSYPSQANLIAEWDFNEYTGYNGVTGTTANTQLSVEFWLRIAPTASLPAAVVSWGAASNTRFEATVSTGGLLQVFRGTEWVQSNVVINDGQWHHVAITLPKNASMNPGTSIMYIDGALSGVAAFYTTGGTNQDVDNGAPVMIGARSVDTTRFFTGEIDDVRIWDTTLNANIINAYLGTTSLGSHPLISRLQYHVHNDAASATVATDFSGKNRNGVRVDNATWVNDKAYDVDLLLKTKLEGRGLTVQMMKPGEISNDGNEAKCAGLVYVSTTAPHFVLQQKLRNISVPVIVAQPRSFSAMGLVPTGAGNWGGLDVSQTQVNVTDISTFSTLAANIPSTGNRDVYTTGGAIIWGRPNPTAVSVAQTTSLAANKTVFGYETGSQLVGGQTANARRVGFFLNTFDIAKLKPQYGDSLFNRAICWALGNCPTSNTITTNTVSPAVYCPGDSITVPFTTSGTFTLTTDVTQLPNNVITADIGGTGSDNAPTVSTVSTAPTLQTSTSGINGGYFRFLQGAAPASVAASINWSHAVPYKGVYKVEFFVPDTTASLNTNVTVRLSRPDTADRDFSFNQNTAKNTWVTLGHALMPAGQVSTFRLLNTGTPANSLIVGDAIRLTLISVTAAEGNDFTLQLSDKNGSFADATVIGKLENNNTATSMKGRIPTFLPQGSNYKVRVVSNVPTVIGTATPTSITINASAPEPTGPIIGNTLACAGATTQGYKVVNPPSGATGYLWEIPLGAQFIGASNTDTVTIQFTTATTNDISVRKVGACGTSAEKTLKVTLSAEAPPQPGPISGRTVVCTALNSETYVVAPVTGAVTYNWTLPTGALAVGDVTGNSITVNFAYATQGNSQISVRAVNDCGQSIARTLPITIDNAATLPSAGAITGSATLCPYTQNVLYSVPPVAGATAYLWSVSGVGASIDTSLAFKNQMRLSVDVASATISVSVVDACGTSAPSTRVINVTPSSNKRALVITDGNIATPNAGDANIKSMLEAEGYTVVLKGNGTVLVEDDYCYTLGVISPSASDNCNDPLNGGIDIVTKTKMYRGFPIPMIVMNPYSYVTMGIGTANCNTNTGVTSINIVNAGHPLANGLSAGTHTILSSSQNYVWANPVVGTVVANTGTTNQNLIWAIDANTSIPANTGSYGESYSAYTSKARMVGWVGLGHHDRSGSNPTANYTDALNATGVALFKRAACWATNSCDPMAITITNVSGSTFCAGEAISVVFNVTGTIGTGNDFQLQLSNSSGSFASPTLLGSITSNTTGSKTIVANLPLSLTTGSGYKVRIRATNAVTLSGESSAITINAVPAQASVITGTANVCPAQTGLVYSVTNTSGVTYNWTVPVGASITSGQGTNSIVANMSGANSGSVTVTTTQGGCTNTNARTLALNFISTNTWTGAVNDQWHNTGNWSCGFLPTATTDVTINATANNPVITLSGAVARNLTVNASASVTLLSGDLSLTGNLTNTAGSFVHSGGTLVFNGTTAQTITKGSAQTLINVTVNNSAGVILGTATPATINGTLTFTSGKLNIGNNNLTFGNSAVISGASLTRYIVVPDNVNATNFVTRQAVGGGAGVLFPIGNSSSYNPVTITNSGVTSNVSVRTFTGVYANGKSGALATEKVVNRSWEVSPANTSANLAIKFQWSSAEHLPLFIPSFAATRISDGTNPWAINTPYTAPTGSGVYEMTASGLTGASKFPMFSIVSTNASLPPILNDNVLMVVGNTSLSLADSIIYDTLTARGYNVVVIDDSDDAPADVNSCKFVWIASSVSNANIGTKYRDVVRPVVINAGVFQNMGLTYAQNGQPGSAATTATLRDTTHSLSKGVDKLTTPLFNFGQALTAHLNNIPFLINNSQQSFVPGMVYDSSGNNRNAAMVFGVNITSDLFKGFWDTSEGSPRNSAINLTTAQGRYVETRGYTGVTGTSARSFSAWIKTNQVNGTIVSWGRNGGTAGQSITLRVNGSGKLRLDFGDESAQFVEGDGSSTAINDNVWHHVVFTMTASTNASSTNVKLYVDGNLQTVTRNGSTTIDLSTNQQNVRFGRNVTGVSSNRQYEGLIDDVALWNAELTAAEVSTLYSNTNASLVHRAVYPKQANLQLEMDFIKEREAAIVPILDRGGAGNIVFAAFEQGKDLWNMVAPGKRVTFPYTDTSYKDATNGMRANATTRASFTRVMNNTLCWINNTCPIQIEIATGVIPTTSLCQGQTVNVSFTSANTFNAGNVFTAQLSNSLGSFASPTNIGTLTSTTAGFTPISATIPPGTPVGNGYRIRVVSSNPVQTLTTDNGTNIQVKAALAQPSAFTTSTSTICPGQSGVVYTVPNDPSATYYTWVLPSGALGSSLTNSIMVDFNTATSGGISVSASNGTCASPPRTLALTYVANNTWTGASNSQWHNTANWSCGMLPTVNTDVVIPVTANSPVISTAGTAAKNLTINHALGMTGGTLTVSGNFTNNGTLNASGGTITFAGTSNQTIGGTGGGAFRNVTIDNISDVRITTSDTVQGNFTFVNGRLGMGTFNLTVNGNITGYSPDRYFITDHALNPGSSFLIRPVSGSTVFFPVGTIFGYNPVSISNSGTTRPIKVRSFVGAYSGGNTGLVITTAVIDRTWEIEPIPASGHGVNANIRLNWLDTEEKTNFIRSGARLQRNPGGGAWVSITSGPLTNEGGGRYSVMGTGVTTFSKFNVFSDNTVLPVEVISFSGFNSGGSALLQWKTANEKDNAGFYIEKSTDGVNFSQIGFVEGSVYSVGIQSYSFIDRNLTADSYYRLKIVSTSNEVIYTRAILVKASSESASNSFIVYPNPTSGSVSIEYSSATIGNSEDVSIQIQSIQGATLLDSKGSLAEVNVLANKLLASLPRGMYLLTLKYDTTVSHIKLVKE